MATKSLSPGTNYSIIVILTAMVLGGCGGGGGGSSSTPTPPTIVTTDTTNPEISLKGQPTVTLEQDETYVEAGATATDNIDGSIDVNITGAVGAAVATYTLTYTATDAAGNSSSVTRTVNVTASSPVITSVNSAKWYQQTRLPNGSGWYNNEQQHYTNRTDNSYVSNGSLKIVAKKERYQDQGVTKNYTSARLNSKFAFQYGRVEVRAKLPSGLGTWPAIWMLGKNISELGAYWQTQGFGTTSWPASGEVDIMEHWGRNENEIQSAMHTPSSYGSTVNNGGQYIATATSEFHIYKLEWTAEKMVFSVDDNIHYTYAPEIKNASTWPFDSEQYLLLNFAIEAQIEESFTEAEMEIDYVRIYADNADTSDAPVWADEFDNNGVSDNTNPIITINGNAAVTHAQGTTYTDAGATGTDNIDGSISVTTSGTVGASAGTYILTYTGFDSAGNSATATRTVTVTGDGNDVVRLNVLQNGEANDIWDLGLQGYDAAINYDSCENDGGARCPNIAWELFPDPDRGNVMQITHSPDGINTGFYTKSSEPIDATLYNGGNIIFDIKVVSGDSNISMKIDCVFPCTSGEQFLGSKGASGWETVIISLDSLVSQKLSLSAVDTGIVIWATTFTSTVFQIDDVRWEAM